MQPAQGLHVVSKALLQAVSGVSPSPSVAMIGCGSVGSKMALHLAKSGVSIDVLSDHAFISSHHMARHGLVRHAFAGKKAIELANEIKALGQTPATYVEDVVFDLPERKKRVHILPKSSAFAINTTASLAVREALSNLSPKDLKPRLAEAALFGRGRGAFMLVEGPDHNPTLNDLIGELYARQSNDREKTLLFDPEYGLAEVQIGLGCGSLTMPMTDARLSSMTSGLAEEFQRVLNGPPLFGEIVTGIAQPDSPSTNWSKHPVAPFVSVEVSGTTVVSSNKGGCNVVAWMTLG